MMSDTIEEDERVDDASTAAADDDSAASGGGEDELTLDAVRDELEMTLNNAKKHTRSKATHYKHNLENVRFLLWAYANPGERDIGDALDTSFVAALDAEKANIQYPAKFSKFTGATLAKKQEGFLTEKLRDVIKARLGTPGHMPPHPTLLHSELTPDQFCQYLCMKTKEGGGTMEPGTYKNYRSGLSFLFRRYGKTMASDKFDEVSELLKGVKRISSKRIRRGEGNTEKGNVSALGIPKYTPSNKPRNMAKLAWSSVLKVAPKEKMKRPAKEKGGRRKRMRRIGSGRSAGGGASRSIENDDGLTEFMMGMVDNNPNNPMTTEGVIAARTEGLEEAIEERRQEMEIDAMAEARGESGHHDGDGNAIGIAQRRAGVSAGDAGYTEQLGSIL